MKNSPIILLALFLLAAQSCSSPSQRKMELRNQIEDAGGSDKNNPAIPADKSEGPEISVFSPTADTRGFVVVEAEKELPQNLQVRGRASDNDKPIKVTINGKPVRVDSDGNFSAETSPSVPQILIEAVDAKGNRSEKTLRMSGGASEKEERYALVIGNADYAGAGSLKNPLHDAKAVSETLTDLGFKVSVHQNLGLEGFKEAIDKFGASLPQQAVALFYFAGHGMQVKGENYLMPTDAKPSSEADAEYKCVNVGRILGVLEDAATSVNIVVLDACRNNPFAEWSRGGGNKGLAPMSAPAGSIIVYAADANQTAMDGTGENGLFTEQLLINMRIPNLKIEEVLKKTRVAVIEKSGKKQEPAEYNKLTGDFYFLKR